MRISLLLCAFLLAITGTGWCANAAPSVGIIRSITANLGIHKDHKLHRAIKNPIKERQFYDRGKGTMGLIYTLVLGPVGYIGVHLFSHNLAMRDKSSLGMGIWIGAALVGGLIWWGVASKVSLDDILYYTFEGIIQGLGP